MYKDKLLQIINHYGISNQLKKLNEEIYEFQEAIMQYEFYKYGGDIDKLKKHIIEEYGDVLNVLEQFKIALNLEDELINEDRIFKLDRQLERIKGE